MTATAASIIIVNYNSGNRLQKCLAHLEAQTLQNFDVIVIDNASADDSIKFATESRLQIKVIESHQNLGFAAGNNRAAKEATGEWLIFLNPDAYAATDWTAKLFAATERYPWADAFGSTQIDAGDPSLIDGAGDVFHVFGIAYRGNYGWNVKTVPPDGECFAPCAAAAMYRRERFLDLGGFDERFFCYGEDVDLGFRLRLAGGRCVQLSDARVFHEGSGVTGRYSDFTVYHGNRNRIWMTYKNMPGLLYWPLSPLRWATDLYLLGRSFTVGIGKAYWRAMRDGYGGLARFRESRRTIQSERRVTLSTLARALTWSPLKVSRRAASLRPLPRMGADR